MSKKSRAVSARSPPSRHRPLRSSERSAGLDRRSRATAQRSRFRARIWRARSLERGIVRDPAVLPERRHRGLGGPHWATWAGGRSITQVTAAASGVLADFSACEHSRIHCRPAHSRPIRPQSRRLGQLPASRGRAQRRHDRGDLQPVCQRDCASPVTVRPVLQVRAFRNLTMEPDTANYAVDVVNQGSRLIQLRRLSALNDFTPPAANGTVSGDLAAAAPGLIGAIDDLTVTLTIGAAVPGMPVTLTIPATADRRVYRMGRSPANGPAQRRHRSRHQSGASRLLHRCHRQPHRRRIRGESAPVRDQSRKSGAAVQP